MLDDYIVAYYNVVEYSLVSTLRPSYEGYKVTLHLSYKGRKVCTSLKSGNHGLLICLGGKQNIFLQHLPIQANIYSENLPREVLLNTFACLNHLYFLLRPFYSLSTVLFK